MKPLAFALWLVCAALVVPTAVLLVMAPGGLDPTVDSDIFAGLGGAAFLVLGLTYASVGAVIVRRHPVHPVGWIFCVTALLIAVNALTWAYLDVALRTSHDLAAASTAAVINSAVGEQTAGWLALSLLLFPDGHLPSRRWRAVVATLLTGMALLVAADLLQPGPYNRPFATLANPIGLAGMEGPLRVARGVGWLLVVAGFALGAVSLVVRLRGSRGVERQQLKLVLATGSAAGAVATVLMASWVVRPEGHLPVRMAVLGLVLTSYPIAAGVAILRHHLFDIDRIISRTLVYAVVTIVLAAAYVGFVLAGQALFSSFAGGSNLAIAVSTLVVAALFLPLRSRIQRVVDRRFNRRRYDAQRTLEAFGARLRDQVELETLVSDLRGVVVETMQPTQTSLWLRGPAR